MVIVVQIHALKEDGTRGATMSRLQTANGFHGAIQSVSVVCLVKFASLLSSSYGEFQFEPRADQQSAAEADQRGASFFIGDDWKLNNITNLDFFA